MEKQLEDNKLIADFLGIKLSKMWMGTAGYVYQDYSTSWSHLMVAVDKIESLDLKDRFYSWEQDKETRYNFQGLCVEIEKKSCMIYVDLSLDPFFILADNTCDSKIEAVYKSVVQFIKWYNKDESK